jgi:membrane protease subunit HflK
MILIADAFNPWDGLDKPKSNSPKPPFPKGQSGNALDEWLSQLKDWVKSLQSGSQKRGKRGGSSFPNPFGSGFDSWKIFGFLGVLLIVIWFGSGFFLVQEKECGVILRFGKMDRMVSSGLNWRFPYPFEQHLIQKVAVVNKIESGHMDFGRSDGGDQTLILAGDENMVHIQYTVLWKVKDIKDFLFTAYQPEDTIQVAAESSVREVVGQTTARLALTEGRDQIGMDCQSLLQKILDGYRLGVQIISVQLQRVDPPVQVVKAFNDMQASRTDADRVQKEAVAYENDILPRARGEAEKIRQKAHAVYGQTVARAKGEVGQFEQLLKAYTASPHLMLKRYQTQVLTKILKKSKKIIVDGKLSQGTIPYLPIRPENRRDS